MKKYFKAIAALLAASLLLLSLSACGAKIESGVLKIGVSPSPHAEITKNLADDLKKEGVTLEIVEFTDYGLMNRALENGELDCNFFQHKPYLDDFNAKNKTELVSVGTVHFEPLGIYPGKSTDLKAIKNGASISVPNDATNEARALLLLEANGIIKLKAGVGLSATKKDIAENPNNIEIVEIDAAALPRTLGDVDFSVINGNVASLAKITDKVITSEKSDSTSAAQYANILACKKADANRPEIKKLLNALQSEKTKTFMKEKYGSLFVPVF